VKDVKDVKVDDGGADTLSLDSNVIVEKPVAAIRRSPRPVFEYPPSPLPDRPDARKSGFKRGGALSPSAFYNILVVLVLLYLASVFLGMYMDLKHRREQAQLLARAPFVPARLVNKTHDIYYHLHQKFNVFKYDRAACLDFLKLYADSVPEFLEFERKKINERWPNLAGVNDAMLQEVCYSTAYDWPQELFASHLIYGSRLKGWAVTIQRWLKSQRLNLPYSDALQQDIESWPTDDLRTDRHASFQRLERHQIFLGELVDVVGS
jgi:hypothetical protein